jgi:hypothetical protein
VILKKEKMQISTITVSNFSEPSNNKLNNTLTVAQTNDDRKKKKVGENNKILKKQNLNKTIEPVISPLNLQNAQLTKIPRFKSNYSPLKTNNKGGKQQEQVIQIDINEIRCKVIKRKFSYLWLRKVHGRVLPSVADKNYKISFIRQYFHVWKNQWWYSGREWRLNVKAECFYK